MAPILFVIGPHRYARHNTSVVPSIPWSVSMSVCQPVCVLVTLMSPAKRDEPIEMPFGDPLLDGKEHFW